MVDEVDVSGSEKPLEPVALEGASLVAGASLVDLAWFELAAPLPSELPCRVGADVPLEVSVPPPCGTQPVEAGGVTVGEVASGLAGAVDSVEPAGDSEAVSPAA